MSSTTVAPTSSLKRSAGSVPSLSSSENMSLDSTKLASTIAIANQALAAGNHSHQSNAVDSGAEQATFATVNPSCLKNSTDFSEVLDSSSSKGKVDASTACCGCILAMKPCSKSIRSEACNRCIWLRKTRPGIAVPCIYEEGFSRDKFYKAGRKMPACWKVRNTDPRPGAPAPIIPTDTVPQPWDLETLEPPAKRQNTNKSKDSAVISSAVQERTRSTTSPANVVSLTPISTLSTTDKNTSEAPAAPIESPASNNNESAPLPAVTSNHSRPICSTSAVSIPSNEPNTLKALVPAENSTSSQKTLPNEQPKSSQPSKTASNTTANAVRETIDRATGSTPRASGNSLSSVKDLSVREITKKIEDTIDFHQKLSACAVEGDMLKSLANTTATTLVSVLGCPRLKRYRSLEKMIEGWSASEAQKRPLFETNLADCRAYLAKKDWSK